MNELTAENWLPDSLWDAARHRRPLDPDAPTYLAVDLAADPADVVVLVVQVLPDGRLVYL